MRGPGPFTIAALIAIGFSSVTLAQVTSDQTTSTGIRDRDKALAGAREIQNDLAKANFHNGPWYFLTRIQLSDIGFTEEFFVPTSDHGGGLAMSVSAPSRLYYVPTKKVVLSGEFVPGYSYFNATDDSGDDNRQFNYSARGGVAFLFNHLFLDLYASRADQLRPRISDINRLATQELSEYGLSGELKYSSRTSVTFSTRFIDSSYPGDRYQPSNLPLFILDRNERVSRAQAIHKTFPRTSLTFAGEHASFEFDFATYKDGTRTYAAPGFFYDGGRFTMRGEAGPARIRFDDATQQDFEGILGQISAAQRAGKWSIAGGVERDTDFTLFVNNNYYLLTRATATVEHATTRRLKLRVSSSVERDEYEVPVEGVKRVDDASFTAVGFRYTWRRLTTGVDVGYYQRESTSQGDVGDGIRYILHLSFSP